MNEPNTSPQLVGSPVGQGPHPVPAPAWAAALGRYTDRMMNDLGGGSRPWKLAWVIDFQKIGTFPMLGILIAWYHNTSTAAWIYLAMHGSYGLVWIVKDMAFPDPSWRRRVTIMGGLSVFLGVLVWY